MLEPYRVLTDGTKVFVQPPPAQDPYADYREHRHYRAYAIAPDGRREEIPGFDGWAGHWLNLRDAHAAVKRWADHREVDHG